MNDIEAKCRDCGQAFADSKDLLRCSLDAFAGADDYDLFCPVCESDNIELFEVH